MATSILRRRPAAMAVLVVVLALALVASSSRMAEATPGYFVSIPPSVATLVGWTTTGGAVWASAEGVTVGAGSAIAAGGITIAAGTVAVAAGVGVLVGWGVVESGLWDWATGADPVPPTLEEAGWGPWVNDANGFGAALSAPYEFSGTSRVNLDSSYHYTTANNQGYRVCGWHPVDGFWHCDSSASSSQVYVVGVQVPSNYDRFCYGTTVAGSDPTWGNCTVRVEGGAKQDRQLAGQIACYDPGTGTTATHDFTSPLYAPGEEPPTPRMACPAGHVLTGANLDRVIVGGDGTQDEQLLDYVHPDPTLVTDPTWQYADCVDGSCALVLTRILADGTRADCEDEQINCLGWWDSPTKASEFECLWGPHVVPLSDCDMFREIDQPTWTGPETEQQQPVQTAPGTVANPMVVDDGCDVGFSDFLNPLSGLAKGVGCGLEWAFAPTPATSTRVDDLGTKLRTKAPAAQLNSIFTWVSDLGTVGTGCLHFDLDLREWGQYEVFDCTGQVGSEMTKHRTVLTVAFYGSFLLPLGWWAWRTYAPGSTGTA